MNCPVSSGRNSAYFTFNNLLLVFIYNVNNDLGGALGDRRERESEGDGDVDTDGRTRQRDDCSCPCDDLSLSRPPVYEGQPHPHL